MDAASREAERLTRLVGLDKVRLGRQAAPMRRRTNRMLSNTLTALYATKVPPAEKSSNSMPANRATTPRGRGCEAAVSSLPTHTATTPMYPGVEAVPVPSASLPEIFLGMPGIEFISPPVSVADSWDADF